MRKAIVAFSFLLGAAGVACSSDGPDLGPDATVPRDAGTRDAGSAPRDAGRDAGPIADAGEADSDAGFENDAGLGDAAIADSGSADAGTADAGTAVWQRPACAQVSGTAGVTFTFDEGATLAPTAQVLTGVVYTLGLVALGRPNTLLAVSGPDVLRSVDSGCTWMSIGQVSGGFPPQLAAAGEDRAYGWSDNNPELFRVDGTTITVLGSPVSNVHGLAVDPADPDHVRLVGENGQIWDSTNAGARFSSIGTPAFAGNGLVYRGTFDPSNLDHVLVGAATDGARWTIDAGATWQPATGLTTGRGSNIFSLAISPALGDVVWAEGIDLEENINGVPGDGRHIWHSDDGGRSFAPVLTRTATVTLINGNLLVPHPVDTSVLYFVFGTYFQGIGTDLYRYDVLNNQLSTTHNAYHDVSAIDFVPGDADAMFLGVSNER